MDVESGGGVMEKTIEIQLAEQKQAIVAMLKHRKFLDCHPDCKDNCLSAPWNEAFDVAISFVEDFE